MIKQIGVDEINIFANFWNTNMVFTLYSRSPLIPLA